MKSLWNEADVTEFLNDPLTLRVYTSRLLGQEEDLVLHGGGNTSVKAEVADLFGEKQNILYVKGSGWDLATIEAPGFAPVKMDVLTRMAQLDNLSDTEMVKNQRAAMLDPYAPNPSVEAILHAIIPFKFVDHTHADAVVTITNTPTGEDRIKEIYGNRIVIIPYVMPGFILAKTVYEMTKDLDWSSIEGLILLNHGVFTFNDDAQKSYEKMIELVTDAEQYLESQGVTNDASGENGFCDVLKIVKIRQEVSRLRGEPVLAKFDGGINNKGFSDQKNIMEVAQRGPLTPDHVIRTKRIPAIINGNIQDNLGQFKKDYENYFGEYKVDGLRCLDKSPRWAVSKGEGTLCFGQSIDEVNIISDITNHTIKAITRAEKLGEWKALPAQDIFDVEYWELEQAKLKKAGSSKEFQGKIALVTGAASGIGKACVEQLNASGAVVAALDINSEINELFISDQILSIVCDVTDSQQLKEAVEKTVKQFGGLDILVSNAGIFPAGEKIESLNQDTWQKSMDVNLSSHQQLLQVCIPYLSLGIDPAVVIVASKNVPAPGPGASAYSVAKAGLTQLARVAALELADKGIRVNVVHPNQIFDTAIWTDEVLENRAKHYNMSVEEYKTNNLLKVNISSKDVANLVTTMAGSVFGKSTGVQVAIDGGNDRVI